MMQYHFYTYGVSDALHYASEKLTQYGCIFDKIPSKSVTHLLLPAPSFLPDGTVKGGLPLSDILSKLSDNITVIGGNLRHPQLYRYNTFDVLQDEKYLAQNAQITAHCAVMLAMQSSKSILWGKSVLVIGWGRIGKCLAASLKCVGCRVTVAARKEADRSILEALGYDVVNITVKETEKYAIIFNTVPVMVLPECSGDALKIELASAPGISGSNLLDARGLPGKFAPESSGILMADTIYRYLQKQEEQL